MSLQQSLDPVPTHASEQPRLLRQVNEYVLPVINDSWEPEEDVPYFVAPSLELEQYESKGRWPRSEDWDRLRPTIKRLYVDEDKTLKEVMSIMEAEHSHLGTTKMYKSRITKWNLDKNNKETDMHFILHKMTERAATGKISIFQIRGKKVNYERVQRYFRRKGGIPDTLRIASRSPPYIAYRTPSPIPMLINPPTELHNLEQIFNSFGAYHEGSFSSGIWFEDDGEGFCASVYGLGTGRNNQPSDFLDLCHEAGSYFLSKSPVRGRRLLSQGCNLVRVILETQDPYSVSSMIQAIDLFVDCGLNDVAIFMIRFISAMAEELLAYHAPGHPLPLFWCLLKANNGHVNTFRSLTQRLLQCTHTQFRTHLGEFHTTTCELYHEFLSWSYDGDLQTMETLRRAHLNKCKDALWVRHPVVQNAALELARTLQKLGGSQCLEEAEEICLEVAASCSGSIAYNLKSRALEYAATAQQDLGKLERAECNMKEALRLVEERWGYTDPWVINLSGILQRWLRQWGREDEADEMDIDIDRRVGRDEVDEEFYIKELR